MIDAAFVELAALTSTKRACGLLGKARATHYRRQRPKSTGARAPRPVPRNKLDAYRRMAEQAGKLWKEHGALQFWECVGDDVKPGKLTSFPQSVQLKDDEVVVFSWILYNSREHRDNVNTKVMEDPRMKPMMDPDSMPFDGKRMFWGGFESLVEL